MLPRSYSFNRALHALRRDRIPIRKGRPRQGGHAITVRHISQRPAPWVGADEADRVGGDLILRTVSIQVRGERPTFSPSTPHPRSVRVGTVVGSRVASSGGRRPTRATAGCGRSPAPRGRTSGSRPRPAVDRARARRRPARRPTSNNVTDQRPRLAQGPSGSISIT